MKSAIGCALIPIDQMPLGSVVPVEEDDRSSRLLDRPRSMVSAYELLLLVSEPIFPSSDI